jgi:hypothetical protein
MFVKCEETRQRSLIQFARLRDAGLLSYRWSQFSTPFNHTLSLEQLKELAAELSYVIQQIEGYRLSLLRKDAAE